MLRGHGMNRIYIYSEKYNLLISHLLPGAYFHCFGGIGHLSLMPFDAPIKLAEIISVIIGNDLNTQSLSKLCDFLSANNHIHLDAFINICLEETI